MSTFRLDRMFEPRSVALVGASTREHSVGRTILRNLKAAGFAGPIRLVNPRYSEIEGIAAIKSVADLPETDLLVIASPPASIPDTISEAGARGCAAAVIVTAGLGQGEGSIAEAALTRRTRAWHAPPWAQLPRHPSAGREARCKFRSTHVAAGRPRADFAIRRDCRRVWWNGPRGAPWVFPPSCRSETRSMSISATCSITSQPTARRARSCSISSPFRTPAKFMSAARAAARTKPVVVIKSGRHGQAAFAARTHTGALAGSDAVYEAAFRRAGLVRVIDLDELFDAAETLGHVRPFNGNRLAILTNGGGIGVLAVDRLIDLGGQLASLSPDTLAALDAKLPPIWSRANPVDIAGDADASRYGVALEALIADPGNDAILVMNVPTALASAKEAAAASISVVRAHRNRFFPPKPVFAVWVGDNGEANAELESAGIPHFQSETDAVRGFMHLVRYREGQDALMAVPPSLPDAFQPDLAAARSIVQPAIEAGRIWLDPMEIAGLMAAYAIPVASVVLARDPDEAAAKAKPFLETGAVAVKILSADIVHKSDIGGVRLNLASEARCPRGSLGHPGARASGKA